jgi:hypothetical protein
VDASLRVTIWNQALQSPLCIRAQRSRGNLPKLFSPASAGLFVVNAVSIFLTCAEVKFPRPPISVISRQGDHELRFWEADRDGAEAVLGLAH